MTNCVRALPIAIFLAGLAACAGNGEGLDKNGRPLSNTPGNASGSTGTVLTADFDSIQDNVFTPVCSVCHAGATAPQGLRLDPGSSFTLLVGVASNEVPTLTRVQPGNPDASYLLQKIIGTAAVGQRMPLGGPYLPQATIDVLRQWIANGAQASMMAPIINPVTDRGINSATGLRVVSIAPLDGAVVASAVQIVVGFNRELDSNLINATTVALEKLGAGNESVPSQVAVPTANASTLLITPRSTFTPGTYRLTLRGSGGGALAGLDSIALNAPTASASGSDYTSTFAIEARP